MPQICAVCVAVLLEHVAVVIHAVVLLYVEPPSGLILSISSVRVTAIHTFEAAKVLYACIY